MNQDFNQGSGGIPNNQPSNNAYSQPQQINTNLSQQSMNWNNTQINNNGFNQFQQQYTQPAVQQPIQNNNPSVNIQSTNNTSKKKLGLIIGIIIFAIAVVVGIILMTKNGANNGTFSDKDKGIINKETFSIVDYDTEEKAENDKVEVIKTYGFFDLNNRLQRVIFLKNKTNLNLRIAVASSMLDESGNAVEEETDFIDALGPNKTFVVTEDYFNKYKDFNSIIKVKESDSIACEECISISEKQNDDELTLTYKNVDNKKIFGYIKIIAYKDGKVFNWVNFKVDGLDAGEEETDNKYLEDYDKYEKYIYVYKYK